MSQSSPLSLKIDRGTAVQLSAAAALGVASIAGAGPLAAMVGGVLGTGAMNSLGGAISGLIPNFLHTGLSQAADSRHRQALKSQNEFVQRAVLRAVLRCSANALNRASDAKRLRGLIGALEMDGCAFVQGSPELDEDRVTALLSGGVDELRTRRVLEPDEWLAFLQSADATFRPRVSDRCRIDDLSRWADDLAEHFTTELLHELRDSGAEGDPAGFGVVLRFLGEIRGGLDRLPEETAAAARAAIREVFEDHRRELRELRTALDRAGGDRAAVQAQWSFIEETANELLAGTRRLVRETEAQSRMLARHGEQLDELQGMLDRMSRTVEASNALHREASRAASDPLAALEILARIRATIDDQDLLESASWNRWRDLEESRPDADVFLERQHAQARESIEALVRTDERIGRALDAPEHAVARDALATLALQGWEAAPGSLEIPVDGTVALSIRRWRDGRPESRPLCCVGELCDLGTIEALGAAGYGRALVVHDGADEPQLERRAERDGGELRSLDRLQRESLRLDRYEQWLRRLADDVRLDARYVELRSAIPAHLADGSELRSVRARFERDLRHWAASERTRAHWAVLGDFGTGKSWLALKLACDRLARFLEDPQSGRIPLLIRLRDFPGVATLEDLMTRFAERFETPVGKPDAFRRLLRSGRLLLLFDGLDEMTLDRSASPTERLSLPSEAAARGARVLLTARKTFFRKVEEQRALFRDSFRVFELEELGNDQVEAFLRKRGVDVERFLRKIERTYDLPGLARRPILLEILAETWEELPEERIEVGDVYRIYTDRWIRAVGEGRETRLPAEVRRDLMRHVALAMYDADRGGEANALHADHLIALLRDLLRPLGLAVDEALIDEVRTQGYLIRDSDDRYFFAHRSFMEYFVAGGLVEEIRAGAPDLLARRRLEPELIDFVSAFRPEEDAVWALLEESRAGGNDPVLNGNLLSVLQDIGADFRNRRLPGLRSGEANLPGVDWSGSDLSGAVLESWNVRDACLCNVNFEGAELSNWNLGVRSAGKSVRFAPATRDIITGTADGTVVRLRAGTPDPETLHAHRDSVTGVDVARDGRYVVSVGFDRALRVRDGETGRMLPPGEHRKIVYGVAIFPDGRHVATADKSGWVRIRELPSMETVVEWEAHGATAYSVDVRPGRDDAHVALATGGFDGAVRVWEVRLDPGPGLVRHRSFEDHVDLVNGVRFSPCGRYLASGSNDGTAIVRDTSGSERPRILRGHGSIVWTVAFGADGELFSGSSDTTIRRWSWREEREIDTLEGHRAEVWSVDVDSSRSYVASGSLDGSVRLWKAASGASLEAWEVGKGGQNLDAEGMNLRGVRGMSELQKRILRKMGAVR